MWSLGVIAYQLLVGETPFDAEKMPDIERNICEKEVKFNASCWKHVSKNAKDFIT